MADCTELSKNITQIAMNLASRDGVNNLDDVLVGMKKYFPMIKRQDVVDAIVEATQGQTQQTDDLMKKLNDIKQEARTDKNLQQKIAQLNEYLEKGQVFPVKLRNTKAVPDVIENLREIRDNFKKKLANSEPEQKKRIEDQIISLEQKISSGDIQPKIKGKPLPQSKELERLQYHKDMLKKQIRQEIQGLKPKNIWYHMENTFNTARAIMTSLDLSAVLRQGGFISVGNPIRAAKSFPAMFKAFGSKLQSTKINQDILNRPNAPLYAKSKLYLAPVDGAGSLSKKEEAFMTTLAEKIPLVAGSERAYVTFLNKLRADSFDTMMAGLSKGGQPTQEESTAIANYINVATGRGGLGKLENSAVALNTIFFSAKYATSRFQMLFGSPLYKGTTATRKAISREYAKYLIGLGLVYALSKLAGGEIEFDPRSSDFGKIRIGNTRIDPLSGLSQTAVFVSRVFSGKTKTSTTGEVKSIRGGDVSFGGKNTWDVTTDYLRYKLSPMFSTAVNTAVGTDAIGNPVTPLGTLKSLSVPLSMRDIYDTIQEQGVPKGTALSLLSIFGAGIQTYGKAIDTMSKTEIEEKIKENTYPKQYKHKDGTYSAAGDAHKGKEDLVKRYNQALERLNK